nr:MAG TPA: deoxyuridine 5'-triphosphate nucleotidohydrolase [Crassvirales sp.]
MKRNENYVEHALKMLLAGSKNGDVLNYLIEQDELNKTIPVKCWRENKDIPLPTYAHNGDACCDLYAQSIEYDDKKDRYIVHTGLHIALDKDYECELRPRSSLAKTEYYIVNTPGTIDEPYRGEILVVFKNRTNIEIVNALYNLLDEHITISDNYYKLHQQVDFPYKVGDRIAQILVRKRTKIEWQEVDKLEDLGETDRGQGGYGSSGK